MLIKKLKIFYGQWGRSSLAHCKYGTVAYIIIINGILSFKTNPNPKFGHDVMTYTPLSNELLVPMIMMIPSPFKG